MNVSYPSLSHSSVTVKFSLILAYLVYLYGGVVLVKILNELKKVDHTYLLMFLIYLILNMMDGLVFGGLPTYEHQLAWWIFLASLVVFVTLLIYYAGQQTKQVLWYSTCFFILGAGGFLDILYIFTSEEIIPAMWFNTDFVHFWHPAYIFFRYPWTIKEQIVQWIIVGVILYLVWRYFNRKYNVHGIRKL